MPFQCEERVMVVVVAVGERSDALCVASIQREVITRLVWHFHLLFTYIHAYS